MKIKEHKALIIIIFLIISVCTGIFVKYELDPAYRLFKPVILSSNRNHSILHYDGGRQNQNGVFEYDFTIVSDNGEGIGNEVKLLYDEVNYFLENEESKKCIEIIVDIPRTDHGSYDVVAFFTNYDGTLSHPIIYDHICCIYGYGIGIDAEIYDENDDYDINHKEYWDYFSNAETLICPQK